ncbi:hypothetical protein DJ017_14235 [Phenylobacterium soli]|uniref:Uncharacterized protein n=1 Tax=Phenylobacterium soli TaxID=2170551 RepID=A0A328AML5_9CAUL|nr:hypothetical protein DJ017_14235 [Phenylobacterium soli]
MSGGSHRGRGLWPASWPPPTSGCARPGCRPWRSSPSASASPARPGSTRGSIRGQGGARLRRRGERPCRWPKRGRSSASVRRPDERRSRRPIRG